MNSHIPHLNSKEVLKQQEYTKQQQQLREFVHMKNNSQSKVLSADSMIEDLLSKKETFQKRNPELVQNQEGVMPTWLTRTPPPLFERVWQGVQTAGGLADTPLLSSVLLTSNLPTDTLGYIWSLANRTVPGALTQTEVFLVLALVGLAQAGYVVSNLSALQQVPQAPIPTLDLTLLPVRQPQVYPNTLNVTNLPDTLPFNWTSSETANSGYSSQIGVSYVSSGPMVSPNFLSDQTNKSSVSMKFASDSKISESLSSQNNVVTNNLKMDVVGLSTKTNNDVKRSDVHNFSFPILNDSPSHVINANSENLDPFDDEFTEFQSADFSTISHSQEVQKNVIIDEDEFSNFQNASPNYNSDDLSVLVIGGKPIPSVQQLWVTDKPSMSTKQHLHCKAEDETKDSFKKSSNLLVEDKISLEKQHNDKERNPSIEIKYDAFKEIEGDKYSVFHNPLPDEEDRHSVMSNIAVNNMQLETKSIFQHSLFQDSEHNVDLFKSDIQNSHLEPPNTQLSNGMKKNEDEDDDEYSNFQNFPFTLSESSSVMSSENTDKYDVFRTIVFENTSSQENGFPSIATSNIGENLPEVQPFELGIDEYKKGNHCHVMNNDSTETKSVDSIHFGDIQESVIPSGDSSNIDNLFSSLVISERKNETETNSESTPALGHVEDKYKALRLLEPSNEEGDDFGDFLGAELPNSGNDSKNTKDLMSIQIRCLEACLHLLKDGVSKMSQCSTPELVSEVLSDERANAYLDCLLEVHRVSQRIISQLNCDICASLIAELHETWDRLAPYFRHSEHTHMVETVGSVCAVCRSNTGPSPVTFGAQSFHTPCANLYLHCVEPVLPNIAAALVQ